MNDALDRLATVAGVEPSYHGYWGRRVRVQPATLRALLTAMGYDERKTQPPTTPAVTVLTHGDASPLKSALGERTWLLELEGGERFSGDLAQLPLGYHRLTVRERAGESSSEVIVVPSRCYLPPEMENGRVWALSTQLYALRSKRNWGIGDFSDLAAFSAIAGRAGAGAVALNPVHELHPSNPRAASPYGPSSRLFLNVLYIDPAGVPELNESPPIQATIGNPDFQRMLESLRGEALVDYERVANVKLAVLEQLNQVFRANHLDRNDERAAVFRRFVLAGGVALERLAIYETLCEFFRARDTNCYGWQEWPNAYRSPEGPEVSRFAREHRARVEFYLYLQWQAQEQLAAAARVADRHRTRLYTDLAVGVSLNGADAWSDQDAIIAGASLGAPPDPLNAMGQNWGLAPLSPRALRERAYAPFVALLRANMRFSGILRIDHVMALRRAFLIPRGAPAKQGAYVRYPFEEMLGVLALESIRNRCAVVGEDLGTVPEGFRDRIHAAGVLSTRVMYFERDAGDGSFVPPERYPRLAAASIGTHDLPTLAAWWTGEDLVLRAAIALYPSARMAQGARRERRLARLALVDALERAAVIDPAGAERLRDDARRGGSLDVVPELTAAAHRFLSSTPSLLIVVAIEDILAEAGAVNVPGTFDEHPNWRRKRGLSLEALQADARLRETGTSIGDAHSRSA
jgi:4-alpha-glucanotransferase